MEITFLGTGPAINIPRKGCQCLACKDARKPISKSKRTNSSILIQNQEESILIDCTPNFLKQIKNLKIYKLINLKTVLLTHAHKDAAGGIKQLFQWLREHKSQTILYLQRVTAKKLKIKNQKSKTQIKNTKIIIIKPFEEIKIHDLKIVSFPVFHGLKKYPTFGYLIEKTPPPPTSPSHREEETRWGRNAFVYASDMGGAPKKSLKYFKKAKILILDASMWFSKKIKGHFNIEETMNFTTKLSARGRPRRMTGRKIYLTHIGHTFPPHQKAQKEINRYLKKEKIPLQATLAYDAMKIKMNSY